MDTKCTSPETCDEKLPHLMTHVCDTLMQPKTDMEQTRQIHEALAARDLLPETHVVDAGYVDAAEILHSRITYGIELTRSGQPEQPMADQGWSGL